MYALRTLAGGLLVPSSYRTGRTSRHVRRNPGGRSLAFESAAPYAVSGVGLARPAITADNADRFEGQF